MADAQRRQPSFGQPSYTHVRDITEEKTAEEWVRWSANHDQLTRLANPALFNERLQEATTLVQASGERFGVLLLGLHELLGVAKRVDHQPLTSC